MEMNPDQLYQSAINPITRKCIQLNYEDFDIEDLWKTKLGNLNYNNSSLLLSNDNIQ